MGRVKVTPKGKVKNNVAITRIGRKQYLKRRFANKRAIKVAGSTNTLTQKYFRRSAENSFARLGLTSDPSAPKAVARAQREKVKPQHRRRFEEEDRIQEEIREKKEGHVGGRPVTEHEGTTIANLIARYGTDIKRMTLDRKLNPFQLNARQLQRQVVNYLRWEKLAFPEQFAEAEAKGWFSVEEYSDPRLRYTKQA